MDYILRYPLNKAHYNQRQAEAKERVGHYSSALEFRKIAYENLKHALTLTSNDVVRRNIQLQSFYEQKQIAQLSGRNPETNGKLVHEVRLKLNSNGDITETALESAISCQEPSSPSKSSSKVVVVPDDLPLVQDLETCHGSVLKPKQKPTEDSNSFPFILYPMGKNYISPHLSIGEFAPLDCPSLDFLRTDRDETPPDF